MRDAVIGPVNRKATAAEIEKMRGLVRQGMEDGAFGLSTGLFYVPGTFTPTAEVIELAKVAGRMGGIYISHMRDEATGILDSVRETIEIGEKGGLPTQVTHHKIIGKANWGKSVETLKLIDEARARGVDATIDQYPYTASSTSIQAALMPAWALEGGRAAVLKRLQTRVDAQRAAQGDGAPHPRRARRRRSAERAAGALRLGSFARRQAPRRRDERAAASSRPIDNAAETALWIVEKGGCSGIFHAISEDDLQRILRHPATMIGSDGEVPIFGVSEPASAQLRHLRARARAAMSAS